MLILMVGGAPAITVQVDPVSGVDNGVSPFLTVEAALAAVAGADAGADVVNLRTNGVHQLSDTDVTITAAAADGDLTIQRDPGDTGSAIVVLGNPGSRHLNIQVDPTITVELVDLTIIASSAATGALGGDGLQIQNPTSGGGIGTVDMTNVVFAANDGSDAPVPLDQSRTAFVNASWPDDDWVDFFPDTAGTLTNVTISHAGDEGMIIRGQTDDSRTGANVTLVGRSAISHCGGRAIQPAFGSSGGVGIPTLLAQGTAAERIRIFGNVEANPEPTVTLFNGDMTFDWVDVVDNNDVGFRVDTDTCDQLTITNTRIARNAGQGIIFLFGTGDLTTATISDSTFHNQGTGFPNVQVDAAVTNLITIDFTDCIFTGAQSGEADDQFQIDTGTTAVVNVSNCALVTSGDYRLPSPVFNDLSPTSETGTISSSPNYVSVVFDGADLQNADFLRVTGINAAYLTGASGGGELRGGNGLPIVSPPTNFTSPTYNVITQAEQEALLGFALAGTGSPGLVIDDDGSLLVMNDPGGSQGEFYDLDVGPGGSPVALAAFLASEEYIYNNDASSNASDLDITGFAVSGDIVYMLDNQAEDQIVVLDRSVVPPDVSGSFVIGTDTGFFDTELAIFKSLGTLVYGDAASNEFDQVIAATQVESTLITNAVLAAATGGTPNIDAQAGPKEIPGTTDFVWWDEDFASPTSGTGNVYRVDQSGNLTLLIDPATFPGGGSPDPSYGNLDADSAENVYAFVGGFSSSGNGILVRESDGTIHFFDDATLEAGFGITVGDDDRGFTARRNGDGSVDLFFGTDDSGGDILILSFPAEGAQTPVANFELYR